MGGFGPADPHKQTQAISGDRGVGAQVNPSDLRREGMLR